MKKTLFLLGLTSFLTMQGWAEPLGAEQTEARIQAIRQVLPSEFQSCLDDPSTVLVLANLQPEYQIFNEQLKANELLTEKVYKTLNGKDIFVQLEDDFLTFRSLPALKDETESVGASWVYPVPEGMTHEGWDEWATEQTNLLNLRQPDSGYELKSEILRGSPKTVFENVLKSHKNVLADDRELNYDSRFSRLYSSADTSFYILPESLEDASFRAWHSEREELLSSFYSSPAVRQRQASREWLASFRSLHGEARELREAWLLKDYRKLGIYTFNSDAALEMVLIKHIDQLVEMIEKGRYPDEWIRALAKWSDEDGLIETPDFDLFEKWAWYGAYEKSEARSRLFRSMTKVAPDYFPAVANKMLDEWLEFDLEKDNSVPDSYDTNRVFVTFSHPEVKKAYQSLDQAKRAKFDKQLTAYMISDELAPLVTGAPYNLTK